MNDFTRRIIQLLPAMVLIALGTACQADSDTPPSEAEMQEAPAPAPAVPTAVIAEPTEGAHVPAPNVTVRLAAEHVTLAPAGTQEPNTGHLHLFLNRDLSPEGEMVPQGEDGIVHLGKAQTEHVFEGLAPGDYTLIAVVGDWAHVRIPGSATDTVHFMVH